MLFRGGRKTPECGISESSYIGRFFVFLPPTKRYFQHGIAYDFHSYMCLVKKLFQNAFFHTVTENFLTEKPS